jgi:hypothetical protein
VAGWAVGTHGHDARGDTQVSATIGTESNGASAVSVFSDGTVSVQVRRAPLGWLLDELARRGAKMPMRGQPSVVMPVALPASGTSACVESDSPATDERKSESVLQALREGSEAERAAALREASTAGIEVPSETLQQLAATDPSAQVRVQAYKAYLDSTANDATAFSAALAFGHDSPSSDVRAEASKRQIAFDALQRVQASAVQ